MACTQGQDCWVVNYADADPVSGSAKDFMCGGMTYDGHDGTDIALLDHRAIARDTAVVASMAGRVVGLRNTDDDHSGDSYSLQVAKDKKVECGNGVLLDHGQGWETQYCHLKKGSITVVPGQQVERGARLGAVGQSGLAAFAHMHFTLRRNKVDIDPFTGAAPQGCGRAGAGGLWERQVSYDTLIPYAAGFGDDLPEYTTVTKDTSSIAHISRSARLMSFWVLFYGARAGDMADLSIIGPDGNVIAKNAAPQPQDKIRMMQYIALKTSNKPLRPGIYKGKATLSRQLPDGTVWRREIERVVSVGD